MCSSFKSLHFTRRYIHHSASDNIWICALSCVSEQGFCHWPLLWSTTWRLHFVRTSNIKTDHSILRRCFMDAGEHEGTYCHLIMYKYLYIACSRFKGALNNFFFFIKPKKEQVGMTTTLHTQWKRQWHAVYIMTIFLFLIRLRVLHLLFLHYFTKLQSRSVIYLIDELCCWFNVLSWLKKPLTRNC